MENEETKTEETKTEHTLKFSEMVERMEKANAEAKEIIKRQEELAAMRLLGGTTDNATQPETKKEETPAEYAKRIMTGKI